MGTPSELLALGDRGRAHDERVELKPRALVVDVGVVAADDVELLEPGDPVPNRAG